MRRAFVFSSFGLLPFLCACTDMGNVGNSNNNNNGMPTDDACDDGAISLHAELSGSAEGSMGYRELADGCREFIVRVTGAPAGDYDVNIDSVSAGSLTVPASGTGVLIYTSQTGSFPANFPTPTAGASGEVAGLVSGSFVPACPAVPEACGGDALVGTCDEDASDFLEIIVTRDPSSTNAASTCPSIKATLETRVSSAVFRNNHPTRTIAVSAVLITESDKQALPAAPCDLAVQSGAYATVDDCLANLAQGCNSPAGLFIAPGDEVGPWLFNCLDENLFPASGTCGERSLETVSTFILAEAVFCSDFAAAQASFCDKVHEHMLLTGMPHTDFIAYVNNDCP